VTLQPDFRLRASEWLTPGTGAEQTPVRPVTLRPDFRLPATVGWTGETGAEQAPVRPVTLRPGLAQGEEQVKNETGCRIGGTEVEHE
jgi:hypothetical protein